MHVEVCTTASAAWAVRRHLTTPPYQNDAFMNHVRDLATFERVRAARPAHEGAATVMPEGRDWTAGEHPKLSKQHDLVELSPPWTAHARSGLWAQFVRLHQSLICFSPEMPIATRLK